MYGRSVEEEEGGFLKELYTIPLQILETSPSLNLGLSVDSPAKKNMTSLAFVSVVATITSIECVLAHKLYKCLAHTMVFSRRLKQFK